MGEIGVSEFLTAMKESREAEFATAQSLEQRRAALLGKLDVLKQLLEVVSTQVMTNVAAPADVLAVKAELLQTQLQLEAMEIPAGAAK